QPSGKASEHVVAEELHGTTEYSRRTPSPRRSTRSSRIGIESSRDFAPRPPARVGADCPPSTRLLTKTLSSSAKRWRRNDQITVLPPSTRMLLTPREDRRSRRRTRSTSSFPQRRTSAG